MPFLELRFLVKIALLTLGGCPQPLKKPSLNEAQEMTPKLLALAKVCSVLGNIHDVSWHLSKRGSELEKKVNISHFGQKQCAQK